MDQQNTNGGITSLMRVRPKKSSSEKKMGEKRGPGRPCKQPKKDPPQRRGIIAAPTAIENVVELTYDMPMILKKLVQLFKLLSAKTLQFIFRREEVIIYARDHQGSSRIRVRIDARRVNSYYVREPIEFGMNRAELELVLNRTNKDYTDFFLWLNETEFNKNVVLSVKDEVKATSRHTILLQMVYDRMTTENDFLDENYTIKINLPGKYFKTTINDIKALTKDKITVQQESTASPIKITCFMESKKINTEHILPNNNQISVASSLVDGGTFWVELEINHIRPISSALLADRIDWFLDENKPTMFRAMLDNGVIEVKILTDIVDGRANQENYVVG